MVAPYTSQGTLRGFDQNVNCILEDSRERAFAPDGPMTEAALGLYIIRGDNMFVFEQFHRNHIAPRVQRPHLSFCVFFRLNASHSAVIGELDEGLDAQTDWEQIRADALKPVVH